MKKVRYGIVGLGNQGTHYAVKLFGAGKIENGVIGALCDIDPARIDSLRGKGDFADIPAFTDYRAMLDSGTVDAVLVETPHYIHPEIVMACLARGIHVLCEKPAGVYTKQVREMNEAASRSGARFSMMFNQRTNCVYRKMRELIAAGEIGALQRVTWIITDWFRTQQYYDSGNWRATWEGEGGGVLINQCPHQIDLLQWIVGEMPVTVRGFCGYGRWHDIEVEDEVTAFFTYKNGATGVFVTTTGETPGTNRLEISGTRGKLLCDLSSGADHTLYFYRNATDTLEHSRTATSGFVRPQMEIVKVETDGLNLQHAGILNNFTNAILGLEPQAVDGREGIRGVELMNAMELSGWNGGEEIALPVDEERYLAELNAHRAVSRLKTGGSKPVVDTTGTFGPS